MRMKVFLQALRILTTAILLVIFISLPVAAQSPTVKISSPSATPTDNIDKMQQIKILKEKIATKVAEIREKDKKALLGTVKQIEPSAITLTTNQGDRSISVSEDTLYFLLSKDGKTSTNIKKVREQDTISAYGYLSADNTVSTKYIFIQQPIVHITGKIADKDPKNYTITVSSAQGNQIVDIETYTRTLIFTKEKTKKATGFSKLQLEQTVHIIGTPHPKEANRISASRIIIISSFDQVAPTLIKTTTTSASPALKLEE